MYKPQKLPVRCTFIARIAYLKDQRCAAASGGEINLMHMRSARALAGHKFIKIICFSPGCMIKRVPEPPALFDVLHYCSFDPHTGNGVIQYLLCG